MAGLATFPKDNEPFFDGNRKISRPYKRFFLDTRTQFIGIDTSLTAQTVDLATLDGQQIVIKDETGNASANPITIIGTVDATVNPTISADYGVLRVYGHNGLWQSW